MCHRIELDETRFESFRAWYFLAKMSEITSLSFPRIVLSYVCLFHETRSSSYWLVVPYLHSLQIRVAEVTWSDMLTTRRALVRAFSGAAVRDVARAKSIGFI